LRFKKVVTPNEMISTRFSTEAVEEES